jgi:micrococcal nuclease
VSLEADPHLDNVDLVRAGAAAPYFYGHELGKYALRMLADAQRAKAAKRGLWGACSGTALDPYRAVDTGISGPPTKPPPNGKCDPNYTEGCVPPYPPDLDCADLRAMGLAPVRSVGSDPHGLDGDDDGIGCE